MAARLRNKKRNAPRATVDPSPIARQPDAKTNRLKRFRLKESEIPVKVIQYKSAQKRVNSAKNDTLDVNEQNGIKCTWLGYADFDNQTRNNFVNYSWNFDWTQLEAQGCDGLTGYITVSSMNNNFPTFRVDVNLTKPIQSFTNQVTYFYSPLSAIYEYSLTPHYAPISIQEISYDEMFAPSDLNDTILVVDGKKLHVNKVFLSYHSEFFRAFFSANYKEGQMNEIPIKDVSYQDFGLLLSIIYPETVFPNDKTVEKLLEMADRFIMPSVIGHVEYHLLNNTRIENEKLMWMADAYGMHELLEKTIRMTNTVEKAKLLKNSPEYKKLSKDAKSIVLDRVMQLI